MMRPLGKGGMKSTNNSFFEKKVEDRNSFFNIKKSLINERRNGRNDLTPNTSYYNLGLFETQNLNKFKEKLKRNSLCKD